MKRGISLLLLISLICLAIVPISNAGVIENDNDISLVEKMIIPKGITSNYIFNNGYYQTEDGNILIPQSGSGDLKLHVEHDTISMKLPQELNKETSYTSQCGNIIFTSQKNPVAGMVQVLKDDEINSPYLRTMIILRNPLAPTKYSFEFSLPNDCSLIEDYDYKDDGDSVFSTDHNGSIYVVNNENEILATIDPGWGKDANGQPVKTYYTIEDNTLVQNVEISPNNVFPIVIDPTEHPTRYEYRYLTKAQVKTIRNEYTNYSVDTIIQAIGRLLEKILSGSILGSAWSIIKLVAMNYNVTEYSTWNTIYVNFQKNYAKIAFPYEWHSGHRSYYPHGILKCTYVNSST